MEPQQHAHRDIHQLLMELRQIINDQTTYIMPTRFEQRSLTEEPPDSLDVRSSQLSTWHTRPPDERRQRRPLPSGSSNSLVQPPQPKVASSNRTWRPPPSRTTGEFVPLFGLQAPLFNGDDPVGWILGIQEYFNHFLTTEDTRLAVIDKLIEYPATDWFHHYQRNNIEGSWMDFLLAVHDRFAPELNVDESLEANNKRACKAGDIVVNTIFDSRNTVVECGGSVFNTASESDQPAETVDMKEISDVDSRDDDDFQRANRLIQWVSGDINPIKPAARGDWMSDGTYSLDDRLEVSRMLPICNELPRDIIPVENLECRENSLEVGVDDGLAATIVSEESASTVEDSELTLDFEPTISEGKEIAPVLDQATNVISFASQLKTGVVCYGIVSQCTVEAMCEREMMCYFVDATIVKEFGWKEILIGYNDSDDRRELVSYFGAMKGVHIFDPGDFESTSTLDETPLFLFHYPP